MLGGINLHFNQTGVESMVDVIVRIYGYGSEQRVLTDFCLEPSSY